MKASAILGIDIAKRKFDVCLRLSTEEKTRHRASFSNNLKGFKSLLGWLARHKTACVHACMEATSRYGDALALFLYERQHQVSIVNPRRVRNYVNSRLTRTQNDQIDAGLIADFCAKENPKLWQPASEGRRQLQDLVRLRDFFVNQKNQCSNRLECEGAHTIGCLRTQIRKIEGSIKQVEKQIAALLKKDSALQKSVQLLQTINGVGPVTAAIAIAELPQIDRFRHAGSAVAFAGLDPRNKESGDTISTAPRMSKMGPRLLRKTLYMAALSALRSNPIIRAQTQRLAARGKTGKLALGAAMRKLLRLIYGVLKTGQPFTVNWQAADRALHSIGRASGGDEPASLQLASTPVATA